MALKKTAPENGVLNGMSLKAKLEAVIYAADEPVTLAQLAGLFADEAREWKTERDAAEAAKTEAEKLPLLKDAFNYLELEPGSDGGAAPDGGGDATSAGDAEPAEAASAPDAQAAESASDGAEAAGESPDGNAEPRSEADEAADAKQQAKLRDREARAAIKLLLGELIAEYAADARGIEIREIAGGYRMATKPEFHDAVRSFVKSLKPALKLSLPALETLAVIAYKQPVTAPEVNEIRGVDSSGVFGSLLARKLIVTAGRKQVVGRPILYKTTREFLLRFGLKDVSELPSMEEFEKMAASELEADETSEETAAGAEEAAANGETEEFNPDPSLERDEAEAVAPEASEGAEQESKSPEGAPQSAE
jgi:segregation and condensation protein B